MLQTAKALLEASHLPSQDLTAAHLEHFFYAGPRESPYAMVGLELFGEAALLRSLVVAPGQRGAGVGSSLVSHVEHYAAEHGVTTIYLLTTTAEGFFTRLGYTPVARDEAPDSIRRTPEFADLCPASSAFLRKRLDPFAMRVSVMMTELGITPAYLEARGMALQRETGDLVSVGPDIFGRDQRLTPAAASQWAEMQSAAAADGVTLLLVSGFRSVDQQRRIFVRKINAGTTLEEILSVNAPPGYSEHHTGRAVDIATPGARPLTEEFETTPAFAWLTGNAARYRFRMSYPRGNAQGFVYEPWHWSVDPRASKDANRVPLNELS
jgi:D-alanyl-D-alanine carboxypeptidase